MGSRTCPRWVLLVVGALLVVSLARQTGFPTGQLLEDVILWGLTYAVLSVALWPRRPWLWVVGHLTLVTGLWAWPVWLVVRRY